ncbi:HEAT repeat domain-containing protein [Anabaena sp. CCY 9402-a]|uniref:HEAT repeat domain-containing protein n=1 Tax=Anabaena sp. CCY 9402-a TaxID=3103867 RepID=UPI0039C5CE41
MTSTEGVALQVDDVYVPLGLVERKKQPKPQGDISPEQGSELYKETEITKTFEHGAFLKEVLKHQNTPKSKGRRIAIIGEPGAGKTTLLQQIANWVSREIPQSIIIWVSLADLQGQKLEEYLLGTWLTAAARKRGKAKPTQRQEDDFVALFNQRNVWLLLDGLDEMSAASGNPLTEISRQFRESGFIFQARIVLTCRVNLWDAGINALDDFDIYRTLDFSYPGQVEEFIHKWFVTNPEIGEDLCTALKESGKERIQDLVKNPLRLTLLCLNWQSGDGKLPDTQAGLYQQFVDDFDKWKKEEFALNSHQRQQLNIKLGELAKAAIDKEATRFRLRQDFVSDFLGDADDENSLFKLSLNRGWLNRVGIDTNRKPLYAFFHASFQEYFAATAIDDWHFFLNHVSKNPSQGTYRIFEPQWKQTILLWLGRQDLAQDQKEFFITTLMKFKDGCNKCKLYSCRAYCLAAAGIAEFRDYSRADLIVVLIIMLSFGYFNAKKQKWIEFPNVITEEARSVLQHTDRTKVIAALVQLLQSKNLSDSTRSKIVSNLGQIGTGNEFAIAALVKLLQSKAVDDTTRREAAESLGRIDPGNELAITVLIELLHSKDFDDKTYWQIAKSLGKIDPGNENAITVLLQLLQSTSVDEVNRWQIVSDLRQIGTDNEIVISALVQLLQSNNIDADTRWRILCELGQIGTYNEIAIATLVQLLQSQDVSSFMGRLAISNLEKIGIGNDKVITALVQLLQSQDVSNFTRWQAAESLQKIDPGNDIADIAITALVKLLESQDTFDLTHVQTTHNLCQTDPDDEKIIVTLVQLMLSQDVPDLLRVQATESFKKIAMGNEKAIAALLQLLQLTNIGDLARVQVAESLCQIAYGNDIAITGLVQLLQSQDVSGFTRALVASSLEKIGTGNETAINALLYLLQSTNLEDKTRWQVASSLNKIGTGNRKVITALVQLLQSNNLDYKIRWQVSESLWQIIQNNNHRFELVKAFSSYWQLTQESYNVLWKCAQNMPYPDFYQAWHQHNFATRTIRSLKKILFTRII